MMAHQLADTAARGEPAAALSAPEPVIYGRYGYGCAPGRLRLAVRRGGGTLAKAAGSGGSGGRALRLQAAQPAGLRTERAKVYDCAAPHRPAMMARDKRGRQGILAGPQSGRGGMSPLRCLRAGGGSGPRGDALHRAPARLGRRRPARWHPAGPRADRRRRHRPVGRPAPQGSDR